MAVRFLTRPAVTAATFIAIGLRGVLHVAIVQMRFRAVVVEELRCMGVDSARSSIPAPEVCCRRECWVSVSCGDGLWDWGFGVGVSVMFAREVRCEEREWIVDVSSLTAVPGDTLVILLLD
ncbi:hypothetical protein Tco_0602296 [Tanacetum coccineum]